MQVRSATHEVESQMRRVFHRKRKRGQQNEMNTNCERTLVIAAGLLTNPLAECNAMHPPTARATDAIFISSFSVCSFAPVVLESST